MTPIDILWILPLVLLSLSVLGFLAWIFLTAPRGMGKKFKKHTAVRYAHRGLHGDGVPENSLSAFALACDGGYGIELDVRLSNSGELVVFHDGTLMRMCGIDGKVSSFTSDELTKLSLLGSSDNIPLFADVLKLVDGRVPLLIELKQEPEEASVADRFLKEIKDYKGEYIVESFNPFALKRVRRERPDIFLGLLSMRYSKLEKYKGKALFRAIERLRLNFLVRPDFIAYDFTGWDLPSLRLVKRLFRVPLLAWTVRSEEDEVVARTRGFDTVIFENYTPDASEKEIEK